MGFVKRMLIQQEMQKDLQKALAKDIRKAKGKLRAHLANALAAVDVGDLEGAARVLSNASLPDKLARRYFSILTNDLGVSLMLVQEGRVSPKS